MQEEMRGESISTAGVNCMKHYITYQRSQHNEEQAVYTRLTCT